MGYVPSKAYLDLWIKKNGDHYEFIARFVDDVSFSKDPISVMNELKKTYVMKAVGTPEYYLGGNVIQLGEDWKKRRHKYSPICRNIHHQCGREASQDGGSDRILQVLQDSYGR